MILIQKIAMKAADVKNLGLRRSKKLQKESLFPVDDAPIETLANGAKQSAVGYRYDLLDPYALAAVARIAHKGALKYGDNNWHGIPVESHLNHAMAHIYAFLAGDIGEPHLEHALCRMLFATGKHLNPAINGSDPKKTANNQDEMPSQETLDAIQRVMKPRAMEKKAKEEKRNKVAQIPDILHRLVWGGKNDAPYGIGVKVLGGKKG